MMRREQFEALGLPWPEPDPEMGGRRFTACLDYRRESNDQVVHRLPPSAPSRTVATAFETWIDDEGDEHERATAWRDLDDAEWAAALAAHEADKARGTMFLVKGRAVESAEFVLEDGGIARGVLVDGRWRWNEWSGP